MIMKALVSLFNMDIDDDSDKIDEEEIEQVMSKQNQVRFELEKLQVAKNNKTNQVNKNSSGNSNMNPNSNVNNINTRDTMYDDDDNNDRYSCYNWTGTIITKTTTTTKIKPI